MRISIHETVFERFPGYRRGLVIARDIANSTEDHELTDRLRAAEEALRKSLPGSDWRSHPRIGAWLDAFQELGVPTGARPPSLAALAKRVMKGGALPLVNQVVALMNITSLERLIPCGGDDLIAAGGDLILRPAIGTEAYRPLGRPDILEHPTPGEIVYVATAKAESVVLCRSWCWRNSEVTKLTETSTSVCLNLDFMAPAVPPDEDEAAAGALAEDLRRHCGGEVVWRLLTPAHPSVDLPGWV